MQAKPPRSPGRAWLWAAGALAGLHLLAALGHSFAASADEAYNLLLSRSLLGGSFATPLGAPATDPLPGFPLLLTLPSLLLGSRWWLYRWPALGLDFLALWLAYRLARRLLPPPAAAAVLVLTAASPLLAGSAGALRPDVPYLALSLALFEGLAAPGTGSLLPWAGLLALAALFRPQGALLVLPLAFLAGRRRGKTAGLALAAAGLLPLGAWFLRNRLLAGTVTGYSGNWLSDLAFLDEPGGQARHWAQLSAAVLGDGLLGLSRPPWPVAAALGAAAAALAARGARRLLREDPARADLAFALAAYAGLVLALHASFGTLTPRYAIPLIPIFWILLAAAAPRGLGEARLAALAALLLLPGLPGTLSAAARGLRPPEPVWPRSLAWIRANLPPGARVESFACMTVNLLGERQALCPGPSPTREDWLESLRAQGVDYVQLSGFSTDGYFPREVAEFARQRPVWAARGREFVLVFSDPGEGVSLYRREPGR